MDIVLIGAGGHGKVVLDIVQCQKQHRIVGFVDADSSLHGTRIADVPVLGGINQLMKLRSQKVRGAIVSIGDNRIRQQYAKEAADAGLELISPIHPDATVAATAKIGQNVVVCAGAIVCPDAIIGNGTIVNTGAIVDHECVIGESVHLCPASALAGRVRVDDLAFVGLGARVIQCVSIGARSIVGAGAVVIRDLPPDATAVGVPARIIQRRD